MSLDDENDAYIYNKLYRSRGKCAIYARQSDVYVELKQKSNARARALVPAMAEGAGSSFDVAHDIWFHIALRLDPEDVQTFALVCKQFARLVGSRVFWRNMYKRHCRGGCSSTRAWNLELPARLQLEQIQTCDTKALRSLVVQALFHCHCPLKTRLEMGYSLDWLLQRTFVTCTQKRYQCLWIICYTLGNQQSLQLPSTHEDREQPTAVVNDWEALADDDGNADDALTRLSSSRRHEGVVLLIVLCRQFMPLPLQLLYNPQQSRFRLKATREMLCTDMRASNLELDFVEDNTNSQLSVTVKYTHMEKYKVLPWWHPDFSKFLK
ncbi:hypothetical protein KR222_007486 [Zaprionus bogoriensis]|nr:hypothetical protein KR222_007486 [Zaprionus bogoriensis]